MLALHHFHLQIKLQVSKADSVNTSSSNMLTQLGLIVLLLAFTNTLPDLLWQVIQLLPKRDHTNWILRGQVMLLSCCY